MTTDGFIGFGPEDVSDGDVVVAPFGSSRPWVLRSHGDHYVMLGEALVPGIMSGRLSDLYEEGVVEAEEFCIR